MKTKTLLYCVLLSLYACKYDDYTPTPPPTKVMLLHIDYTNNLFDGATELSFPETTTSFSINTEYNQLSSSESIQVYLSELNQLLFHGEIDHNGSGQIIFPETPLAIANFKQTVTTDFITPENGFEIIHLNKVLETTDYSTAWTVAQSVIKTREYLELNPYQKIKVLLYPTNTADRDSISHKWIFFLKN